MSLRKYALSPRVAAAALGVVPVIRATRRPKLGVRVGVLWVAWAGSLALALATVRQDSRNRVTVRTPADATDGAASV